VGGADRLLFDILAGKMTVVAGAATVTNDAVVEAASRTGMSAKPWRDGAGPSAGRGVWGRHGRMITTAASALFVLDFVALTLTGHASLWAAIAADMGASLLVIANGLRLLRA
jgi:hypothetical protein